MGILAMRAPNIDRTYRTINEVKELFRDVIPAMIGLSLRDLEVIIACGWPVQPSSYLWSLGQRPKCYFSEIIPILRTV